MIEYIFYCYLCYLIGTVRIYSLVLYLLSWDWGVTALYVVDIFISGICGGGLVQIVLCCILG